MANKKTGGKLMNVLSLFDGMSCGQIALHRAGIKFDKYYASEIDKYAIAVTQHNYPSTTQLGDVTKWREWDIDWESIGLIIGGSPCQGLSQSGAGAGLKDERSALFFVFMDILRHVQSLNSNVVFLLENVVPRKKEWAENMTEALFLAYMGSNWERVD
jgi:DNA (cytosine-5)-methyltransferase 3A